MSIFTNLFHSIHEAAHGLGKGVGTFLSSLADSIAHNGGELLIDAATRAVAAAEATPGGGKDKFAAAQLSVITDLTAAGYPVVLHAINGAIEGAVARHKAGARASSPPSSGPSSGRCSGGGSPSRRTTPMPHSTPPRTRRRLSPSLAAASLLSLAACASTSGPIKGFCPAAVWPSKAAVDWIAGAETPPVFDEWLDKVTRQQEVLDKACR